MLRERVYEEEYVDRTAQRHGWRKTASPSSRNAHSVSYRKDECKLTIWLNTGTCGSFLSHPVQGKTQLFRKRNGEYDLEDIFKNPRKHTDSGYHTKPQKKGLKAKIQKKGNENREQDVISTLKSTCDDSICSDAENVISLRSDRKRVRGESIEEDGACEERPIKRSKISCMYGSFCRREDCYFEHRCRYASFCERVNCRYIHDLPHEEENWWYMQPCRYWPRCLNANCKFEHTEKIDSFMSTTRVGLKSKEGLLLKRPEPCWYGSNCTRKGCWYEH